MPYNCIRNQEVITFTDDIPITEANIHESIRGDELDLLSYLAPAMGGFV